MRPLFVEFYDDVFKACVQPGRVGCGLIQFLQKNRTLPADGSIKMLVIFQKTFNMTMKLHISIAFSNIYQGENIFILYFITLPYTTVSDGT